TKNAKVSSVKKRKFKGHVYNVTTETGNLFVENVLVSNSGGLGTPAHLRVEPGYIHRTNNGVLFIDEIATLSPKSQQELLTAMQEKKYSITGQSELSSGAMTRTEGIPCFPKETLLLTSSGNCSIGKFVDSILSENKGQIIFDNGVEVFDLKENKTVLGYADKTIIPSKLERVYRRKYKGKVLRIKFDDGTELVATPEHPIKTVDGFVKAKDLKLNSVAEASAGFSIINEDDVMKTYCKENQRIAVAFSKWLSSGKTLPAKTLGVDYKTVCEWEKNAVPHALKPVICLQEKNLLPLNPLDKRTPIIARICGALFGDGGLDGRRFSRIYFSAGSNEFEDLDEFKKDIISIFGNDIELSITTRKSTSKRGSGLELSVNNSFIARFFYALGVPKGDKVSQPFSVPFWIMSSDKLQKEFFSSLLTCELYGNIKKASDTPNFVMAKLKRFEKEHFAFLNAIRGFLLNNGVEVSEVKQDKEYLKIKGLLNPETTGTYLFKINSNYANLIRLNNLINFYYAKNKRQAIANRVSKGKLFIEHQKKVADSKQKALSLRKLGKTIRAIAKETGLHKGTVWKSVEPTYNKYSKQDRKKVFDLFDKGIIPKIVSKKLEMPYTTVFYWKNNYYGGF
ncbi:sigma 54-interacting transcriptional regulator, partial [Candidatus Micrarchaeota archaeon]|nr:sigma 54-interacting transcriptional regulator [Candidatus Micrarchaeota archaeon]